MAEETKKRDTGESNNRKRKLKPPNVRKHTFKIKQETELKTTEAILANMVIS